MNDQIKSLRIVLIVLAVSFPLFIKIILHPFDIVAFEVLYGFIFPSAPFIYLAILVSQDNKKAVIRSMIGAIVAIGVPYLTIWYSIHSYSGGGANIGLGLFLLAMPVYLLLAMSIGWNIGEKG